MDYPKINVQFGRVYIIPIHYLTYWRSASPTTNSEIWMTTGNKYLSVRKFLGMCINHKRGHYTSGEGRNKTKRKNIYQSFVPVAKRRSIILSISVFNHIVRSPRIALTAVLLISFYMEPSEIHNTVCAFVYRVRDCKHPVPAIYINDNNLQVRYYI